MSRCSTDWTDKVCGYTSLGSTLLDLQVDGITPEWGEYSPIHVYTANWVIINQLMKEKNL